MIFDRSEKLFHRAIKVIPGGVNSPVRFFKPYPFFVSSGSGSKIVTADHETYLDYCMGYGSLIFGHSYPPIVDSLKTQLDNGNLYCIPSEKEVYLAELLTKIIPSAEKVRLVNTGAEATMTAIRLSRAFTKRKKIIKFNGGYHGSYDYVLVKAGSGAAAIPSTKGSLEEISKETLVVNYNNIEDLKKIIEKEAENVSCLIIEPVLANYGLILPEKNYLNDIRKITKKYGIVLIFDEVITGFRLSLGGCSAFFGITPDISTFSKSLGNGFPISAICGKNQIMDQLSPVGDVYQASTYAGNPISVTAAITTIENLVKNQNKLYPTINRLCDTLVMGIKDRVNDFESFFTINSIGSLFQIFFTAEAVTNPSHVLKSDQKLFEKLFWDLLKKKIFIPPSQYETCFISYSHNEEDIDKTIECYSDSLNIYTKLK
ncbi:MAG TPA: glutamate-1-semialdehyde 2,1-aminomutase [Nitrososphaeraceae archaeon]|nr:glutamate-1-semialdehyde 2,1-aminomutase [Nitrososphaeraceae archaeon]